MSHPGSNVPMYLLDQPPKPGTPPTYPLTLLFDEMESALLWAGNGTGADYSVALSTVLVHSPTHALAIATKATAPAIGDWVAAFRFAAWPTAHKFRMDVWIGTDNLTGLDKTDVYFLGNAGAKIWEGIIEYSHTNAKWYYATTGATFVEIAAWAGAMTNGVMKHLIFDLDMDTHKYLTACLDGVSVDLSAAALYESIPEAATYTEFVVGATTGAAWQQGILFDDAKLTCWP